MVSNSGRSLAIGSLLALVAGFCGSFGCSDPATVSATGGSPATGGATVTGGTSTGGTTSTGGSAPNTGGVPSTGGTVSTGGTSSGGASSTGGASGGSAGAQGGSGTGGASGAAGAATGGSAGSGAATGGSGGSSGNTGGTAGVAGNGSGGAGGGAIGTGGSGGATTGGTAGASTGGSGGAAGGATSCVGNAVSFSANGTGKASDAAHARVMVDLMTDLPIANAHRTLEFWAYIRSTDWVGETNTIFEYGTQDTSAAGFGLDFGGNVGTIDPYTNGGFDNDNQATGLTTSMDQWVHFAMTWDGTAVRTYVNGAVKSTKAGSGGTTMLATVRTQLTIGCNNPRFSCFGGYIDEFRVWSVARSATEIMDNYKKGLVGNETGLVGYWRFNETTGNSAADSVTTANHTKHNGTLMSVSANQLPTFVASTAPITCP